MEAVNQAVAASATEFVLLGAPDMWLDPAALGFLTELAWDCDVTYGNIGWADKHELNADGSTVVEGKAAGVFCPNRLRHENYLPEVALVRRSKFLEAGGLKTGVWDLWLRLLEIGARFKSVPEAYVLRTQRYEDLSPAPVPQELVATFYHQATIGTTYWRCMLPARHLPGQVVFNEPKAIQDGDKIEFVNHRGGTAIIQFGGDAGHHIMAAYMRDVLGLRVLLEADDDYTRPHDQMAGAGWGKKIKGAHPYSAEGHRKTAALVDGVIVTTETLAKRYRGLAREVFVCPNQIEPSDWVDYPKPDDGVFRIGWFASKSHLKDVRLIRRGLEWASRQPGVEVVQIGIQRTDGKRFWPFPYKQIGWSNDFGVYRRYLAELDVGLAPIIGDPWAVCRSDLKILEYAMAGVAPIVSAQPPYADWVDGDLVLKAKDERGFLKAIQHLVANRDEARQMAAELKQHVLAKRTVAGNIDLWRHACSP